MSGINKVILIGRLGQDPEVRYTPDGTAVANFSIATSEEWKDKNSGEKRERTEWHRIVAWRKLGEICGEYLSKGRQVYIEGRIQTRSWEDKDGKKNYTTEVIVFTINFLEKWGNDRQGGAPAQQQKPQYQAPQSQGPSDDDIPF